jgi:aminoglycoside phosphotransferase (APT) family kinase protein
LNADVAGALPEPTPAAVTDALRVVAPELAGLPVIIPSPAGGTDPVFHMASAALGEDYIVKFAWSRAATRFVTHQISVLRVLAAEPTVPHLPEVLAAGTSPAILVTRRVRGTSLFAVADSLDPDHTGGQLARFLAALHSDQIRRRFEAAAGPVPAWYPLVTTDALRERLGRLVAPRQQRAVLRWCDWTDQTLARPAGQVLVHGDLHGDNQIWSAGDLRAILDFENAGLGEPEYELRTFPGPGMGPGTELLTATMRHYQRLTGRTLSTERVMAWHVRQALGDVLWRSEAGLPLPDHRPPGAWVDDIAARLQQLNVTVA